ncbi:MAG: hypothetical protein LBH32_13150 [Dysgonamonadaceae bacterium]|jgi:hypothetical protein|nr:hypothetical protein [Dysgonamonadaceae bacterium]
MKQFFSIIFACSIILLSGCSENESVENIYIFGVTNFEFSSLTEELELVTGYLKGKGCPVDGLRFKGKDYADTDKQAKAAFDAAVAKISKQEIAELGLHESSTFKYTASRMDSSTEKPVTIGEFVYP